MAKVPNRPEEDPAEGSPEVIERELQRQDEKQGGKDGRTEGQGGADRRQEPSGK